MSVKEVERIFLSKVAIDLGFNCDHIRIGLAKEDPEHKPFCKDCWSRLRTIRPRVYNGKRLAREGEYWPLETFLDKFYKEENKRKNKLSHTFASQESRSSDGLLEV